MNTPYTLYTFAISHFSEKIRWVLDHAGLPYTERPLTPFFHVPITRKLGKASTVPVLITPQGPVQDSTRILRYLADQPSGLALLPAAQREEIMQLEEQFDRMGTQVVRLAYIHTLNNRAGILKLWTINASPLQARVLGFAFPLLRAVFRKNFGINAKGAQKAAEVVQKNLDFIAERLAGGHQYLVGNSFSIADLTAAALLAPLACPDQHPIYNQADYRAGMAATVARWQGHAGMDWVRAMYAAHR